MTFPSPDDPVTALTRADGTTEAHSTDHGRVIGLGENVKHHGAKGGDVGDDYTYIQAAITAAGVGGTVYFPRDSYTYGTTLTPLDAQHWVFGGHSHWSDTTHPQTRLRYTGTGTAINMPGVTGVRFSGMRLECTNNTATVIGVAIADVGSGCHWNVFEGCTFKGPAMGTGTGLQLSGQFSATAFHATRDCSFKQWNRGLVLSGYSNSNRFDATTFHSCTTAILITSIGIDTQGGENNTFSHIELDSSCTNGINIATPGRQNSFWRIADDGVPGVALNIALGVTDTSFYSCAFINTITDASSGFETYYFNCTGVEPGDNAALQLKDGFIDMGEISVPPAPTTNRARLFVHDNAAGETQLLARFSSGPSQVITTQSDTGTAGAQIFEDTRAVQFATAANEKADLYFSGDFAGVIEVEVLGYFNATNNAGSINKRFNLVVDAVGVTTQNASHVVSANALTTTEWAIGEFSWDAGNSRWRLPIVHRTTNANRMNIRVRAIASDDHSDYISNIRAFDISSIYTTDPTTYPVAVPSDYAGRVLAQAALATNATTGFVYIPTCAGAPSGTPDTQTGTVPLIFDTTNKKLYIYTGGAWVGGTTPGVFV